LSCANTTSTSRSRSSTHPSIAQVKETLTADPENLADAVGYLASQSPRAMTHELGVTPALDN
jgi:NADP-dependent 3-hydroxy acid dehydrogenase YdfG